MAHLTGTVSEGDKVLVQDVSISLRPNQSDIIGFEGDLVIPSGGPYPAPNKSYELKCSDGRSGQIFATRASASTGRPSRVEFQTSGRFA
jgi:hypothetical protein